MAHDLDSIAETLGEQLSCENTHGDPLTLAGALYAGLQAIAFQLKYLGNGDAATPMGGLEALGLAIKEGCADISDSLDALAEAINNHGGA